MTNYYTGISSIIKAWVKSTLPVPVCLGLTEVGMHDRKAFEKIIPFLPSNMRTKPIKTRYSGTSRAARNVTDSGEKRKRTNFHHSKQICHFGSVICRPYFLSKYSSMQVRYLKKQITHTQ